MTTRIRALALAPLLALTLAACSTAQEADQAEQSPAGGAATDDATGAGDEATGDVGESEVTQIAFFGFWKSNSFTQAVLKGVEEEAAQHGITVVDRTTAQYDAAAQMQAVRDSTVRGDSQLYIFLAADSVGLATAAQEAMDQGITVVAAHTPLGSDFSTMDPQVPGLVIVAETPVSNGENLAELAAEACADLDPCNVAYLEGLSTLPLDNARTQAFEDALAEKAPNASIVAKVEGGYAPDQGQSAAQDALQRNADINVMVGSSQAILGAQRVVDTSAVKLIGNGASEEAFEAVNDGTWFALYNTDVVGMGAKSVELGLEKAAGEDVQPFNIQDLRNPLGTKENIEGITSDYSDLG